MARGLFVLAREGVKRKGRKYGFGRVCDAGPPCGRRSADFATRLLATVVLAIRRAEGARLRVLALKRSIPARQARLYFEADHPGSAGIQPSGDHEGAFLRRGLTMGRSGAGHGVRFFFCVVHLPRSGGEMGAHG